jgi:hypothetical protein
VKRFSQFDVCNRALLDRKVFEELRRPIGLGELARRRRLWLHWPWMGRAWVRIVLGIVVFAVGMTLILAFATSPQTSQFLSRGLIVAAYLFSLCFLLYPPDARMVALSRIRTQAATRGDGPVVRARQEAWKYMLRGDEDEARKKRWYRHPQMYALMLVSFVTVFTVAMLGDVFRGALNAVPFARSLLHFTFIIGSLVAYLLMTWYGKKLRRRLVDRIEQGQCCDCGYQLERGQQGIGPKRCLECGCPWPLVPPELPPSPKPRSFLDRPAWMR